jgi:hypothetical protein
LTSSLCFPPLFNHNQYFLFFKKISTLKFISHTMELFFTLKIFSINNCCACLNIAKVGMVFSKYMDTRSLCFQVYGYYKVMITISKNTNKIFTLCEQILSMYYHFSTHDKYMITYQNWNLIYISHHFSIITNYFLLFFNTYNFVDTFLIF